MVINIGTVSYAAAAVAFLVLFGLLVTTWRGRLQGMLLAMACLCTALWAAAAAYLIARPDAPIPGADVLAVLRSATWFAFLIVLLGYSQNKVTHLRRTAMGLVAYCVAVLIVTLFSDAAPALRIDLIVFLGHLLLAVIGIVLIEQLYRNVAPQDRWGTKFLCVGLGGMFSYDFYLYSDALLLQRINTDIWAARGVVNAMVVPLLALATSRDPNWSLNVTVSRRMLFHSTAMLGAAMYLLVMAAAGYYIQYFGGSWGPVLQVTFLFGAALMLVAILFSGAARARLKVFLSKNFFSYHYDYREEWLRFTRTLSQGEPAGQLHERSIEAIAELVDSTGGTLWLSRDNVEFEQVAQWNMSSIEAKEPSSSPLCQFLERHQKVVDLEECKRRPESCDGLAMPQWLGSMEEAWLVVPLILHERMLGFIVLAPSKGNIEVNWEVRDLLNTAGRQAASYLAQLEATKALLVARQFESFNRMSAFLVHDLKNLVSQHSLLLSNADKHRHKPEFQDDMLETIAQSVGKMKRLLRQLQGDYVLEPPVPVVLDGMLQQEVTARAGLKPAPRFESRDSSLLAVAQPARLERVMGHLIQNAIEATPDDGQVIVRLSKENDSAVVTIVDTGCGMSEQFARERLFRPFESTKSTGMGIGTYEARQYVRELGGQIHVSTRHAQGTEFQVVLPLYVPENVPGLNVALVDYK